MTFSPTEDGTKFSMVIDYELPYSVLGKLIDKEHNLVQPNLSLEQENKGVSGQRIDKHQPPKIVPV